MSLARSTINQFHHCAGLSYGQEWARGDIIGCMIDMDLGVISFARNGQPLGQAFAHIRQLDYYPAASLSYGETSFQGIPRPVTPATHKPED